MQSVNDYIMFFLFATAIFKSSRACNIPSKMYSQDLSNGILQAPKFQTFQLVDQKNKSALEFLSFRCPTLFGETCGCRIKG